MTDIILQNDLCRLVIGGDGVAKSLTLIGDDEELLCYDPLTSIFAITESRPYHNEIKLAFPTKRTYFRANSITQEGELLTVGFELLPFTAKVRVNVQPGYFAFTLEGFDCDPDVYHGVTMSLPPVTEFHLLQLSVKDRGHFGHWLNVSWDDKAAVNVLAAMPEAIIDANRGKDCHVMTARALHNIQMEGTTAALITAPTDKFMDVMDRFERDYDLPLGVESRRSGKINRSILWTVHAYPNSIDTYIDYAKRCGFHYLCLYYPSFIREDSYRRCGDYDYNCEYPNGKEDLIAMVNKIKAAGLSPGFHILQTHVGLESRYVTPVADRRLHLRQHFTLAKPLGTDETEIYVDENPLGADMHQRRRVLKFGGELIRYEGYTTERPYRFYGCERGAWATNVTGHPLGEIGGVLDVSEYAGVSCYVDQRTDLADEIADKIADIYSAGFEFIYFDGSEGTNDPFDYYVPLAQYRVYKKLKPAPIFTEGAAKAHFSWHFLSAGNAFDVFDFPVYKASIDRYPAEEAPRMRDDFTSVNFGWWTFHHITCQPDHLEYGTSHAAGYGCPGTLMCFAPKFDAHYRIDDILEALRRWEEVREKDLLTEEQKLLLREPKAEYTLIRGKEQLYDMVRYHQVPLSDELSRDLRAFTLTYGGHNWLVYWHPEGNGRVTMPISPDKVALYTEPNGERVDFAAAGDAVTMPCAGKRYLCTDLPVEALIEAAQNATVETDERAQF